MTITPNGQILYLVKNGATSTVSSVIPFATATGTPGKPIKADTFVYAIAVTPDGSTVWVASGEHTVTPISTATNKPGTPIKIYGAIEALVLSP